ncbi:MAG: TatD family nuclease-associated radical SAM protein [Firmicutes bacterium]|jgi:TatD family-associated radical SAM protein|nr:TatD family nuclease-associated radical SAM protein [Bacillota bacterium]
MEYIGDVFYEYGGGLYANITNKCPDRCEFCIRYMVDSLGGADSLWLKREPTMEEILELLDQWDLSKFEELVFCGYGEPTERLPELIETAEYARSKAPGLKIRLNTNGLSDLINGRDTLPELSSVLDRISVSLNAKGPEEYLALCHPRFGIGAFEAMLDFTRRAKECIPDVTMSVVSGSIPYQDIEPCRRIAEEEIGVKFRVR